MTTELSLNQQSTAQLPPLTPQSFVADDGHRLSSCGSPASPTPQSSSDPTLTQSSPVGSPTGTGVQRQRTLRKPSPGLLARMKFLNSTNQQQSNPTTAQDIGRIPESELRKLDEQHRDYSIRIQRRGRTWTGTHYILTPQLTGESGTRLSMETHIEHESDHSSIISTSERIVASDSDHSEEPDVLEHDPLKYRLPDIGKACGSSRDLAEMSDTSPYLERPPTPPAKDTPSLPDAQTSHVEDKAPSYEESTEVESYFNPYNLTRANSIYTLSRVSFTSQLSQLTSIQLPDASSLSTSLSTIPTVAAARALSDAARQIRMWIRKASEVLEGLDAEDDVEWAADGGREGLGEVDAAINRFETLIKVYVTAIEKLQAREDVAKVPKEDLEGHVQHMEEILRDWQKIKQTLKDVKGQVEIAMEWEELWSTVLGEIGLEVDSLSRLVFEMEEQRHRSVVMESATDPSSSIDIGDLETIVEEAPILKARTTVNPRFSLPPSFAVGSPLQSPTTQVAQEDSNLLGLFARMQPLRASLDFLPMRLSSFQQRAKPIFPTACEELAKRQEQLENQMMNLENDAESLRKELGEDRWVSVFRNAGRGALKMTESVGRSIVKLRESIDNGEYITNLPVAAKKIENYEAKKMHYGPAVERVLNIIDKGIKDRLTVNGEVLRLQSDMRRKWAELEAEIKELDSAVEEITASRNQQLRESISTILTDRSIGSSAVETPGSSPASSVILMSRKSSEQGLSTPYGSKSRQGSFASGSRSQSTTNRRYSSLPVASGSADRQPRKTLVSRFSASEFSPPSRLPSSPTPSHLGRSSPSPSSEKKGPKPRWNACKNMNGTVVGHHYPPSPSSPRDRTLRSVSSISSIPRPSPLGKESGSATPTGNSRPASTTPGSAPHRRSIYGSPQTPSKLVSPRLTSTQSTPAVATSGNSRRTSAFLEPFLGEDAANDSPSARPKATRPVSALASGRRSSMLPQPKTGKPSLGERTTSTGGRKSSLGTTTDERRRWR
ncbi:KAR9-domain-containing protein [Patellaria atrata CBS 101060]|uniref:KAR9-domain-containing protein n=1 Tax=Patellaria atrata CBS 101060 TaxID=1346257 RepID=A0A9P4S1U0_9PEZI|nr:KAR9-domain-containing protein [Patellaria atrata CBS 101060]